MAKKINTEETPQTDNNNIPAPEAQAVPVPETASENLGTGGETEDRLPAKTAGKGNAGSEETTEPHILSLLKKFPGISVAVHRHARRNLCAGHGGRHQGQGRTLQESFLQRT